MQLLDANGEPTGFLHIHLAIFSFFTELRPRSLKSARLVCRTWSQFIKTQMWMNKKIRKRLEKRLGKQWRMDQPMTMTRELVLGVNTKVDRICCNENNVAVFCRDVRSGREEEDEECGGRERLFAPDELNN